MAGLAASTSLQEADPGLADAGLAIGKTDEVRPERAGHRTEHGLGVGQRNAAHEVHDGLLAAVCAHEPVPTWSL